MTYGVFLTRAQPLHKGHLKVIRQALAENEYVLLIVGSANKYGTIRNPMDVELRKKLIETALNDTFSAENRRRIQCILLDDWSAENAYAYVKEWGCFLYYNIVSAIHQKTFCIYYNDTVDIIEKWFEPYIRARIEIKQISRIDDQISSSSIRDAIRNENIEYLKQTLTEHTLSYVSQMKQCIENATQEDFIME